MSHYNGSVPETPRPTNWRSAAACREVDPEAFFDKNTYRVQEAKRICAGCLVRNRCADFAISNGENWGVWGGMTQTQLRTQRNRRQAQNPGA